MYACPDCQVERLDNPALLGVPLAVRQFNSGGFVAVSYEARAAGRHSVWRAASPALGTPLILWVHSEASRLVSADITYCVKFIYSYEVSRQWDWARAVRQGAGQCQ